MQALATMLGLVAFLVLGSGSTQAATSVANHQNSTLNFLYDDPQPSGVQYMRGMEWVVEGRRILVYPSSPAIAIDVDHIHAGMHAAPNQLHVQGVYWAEGRSHGAVSQAVIYTLEGGASGTGMSRLVELVEVANKTAAALSIQVVGMGWRPTPAMGPTQSAGPEIPDLSGIIVNGSTFAYIKGFLHTAAPTDAQGNSMTGSLTEAPYASVHVLRSNTFSGFNTYNEVVSVPAGATLTVVTDLRVSP